MQSGSSSSLFLKLLCLVLFSIGAISALASTIHIPGDQPTIQAGINAASTGDTVLVAPGTYYENIDFKGKAITVTSSAGPATTIIDGSGTAGMPVVVFKTQELRTSVLSGFTIQHGGTQTASSQASGGIFVSGAAPTIRNNIVTANQCSGIFAIGAALIQGNTVSATQYDSFSSKYSYCQQTGTGVVVEGTASVAEYTHVELVGNTIQNNTQALGSGGIAILAAEGTLIQDNIISNNSSSYVGGIVTTNVQAVSIINNLIYGNSAGVGNGPGHAGGMQISAPQSVIEGNTFGGNSLASGGNGTSATEINFAVNFGSSIDHYVLTNNIVVGASSTFPALNCTVNIGTAAFDHNDVYNANGLAYGGSCSDQTGNRGNISANPNFVRPGADFHLTASSPAIDSGNNSAPDVPTDDLDGNPRIQDAIQKGYPVIDMGAYEYPGKLDGGSVSTTITSSLNPSDYGQSVTFTATVTDASSTTGSPTGTVTFTDGTTILAATSLSSAGSTSASASFTTGTLNGGTHLITATYTPATGVSSSASLTQIVTGIATTASLTSSLNPAPYGSSVTLTAIVTNTSNVVGAPTGTITFMDGSAVLATQQLVSSGGATSSAGLSISTLSVGSHIISAVYNPSGAFITSTATLSETINGYSQTTTTLTGSPNPAIIGKTVTFLSSVSSTSPGAGPPTGAVTFTADGTTLLGTQTLVATSSTTSQASLAVNTLTLGGHAILASYNATGNFMSSTAAITETIVSPADFTITTTSPNLAIKTEQHLTTMVTLTSINSFADNVTVACSNLPPHASCTFDRISLQLLPNGTATTNVAIDTDDVHGYARNEFPRSANSITYALLPASLLTLLVARRRRSLVRLLLALIAIGTLTLSVNGCSGLYPKSTPPGTYTINLSGAGANTNVTHTQAITLTVTP